MGSGSSAAPSASRIRGAWGRDVFAVSRCPTHSPSTCYGSRCTAPRCATPWTRWAFAINRHDSSWKPLTAAGVLIGRCKTTLWANLFHADPDPYLLELRAVDSCKPDDVFIAAAGGSTRSGVWGELLSTAAHNRGCVGAVIDGMARDVAVTRRMGFPVFAFGACSYDSRDRQRVVDMDVPVELDGVRFHPGDLVIADEDGVVVVPSSVEAEALWRAWNTVHSENEVRDAIRGGMKATDVFRKYGVL
ncbi:MAG: RraA family protein [Gemmataceae bacterium]